MNKNSPHFDEAKT